MVCNFVPEQSVDTSMYVVEESDVMVSHLRNGLQVAGAVAYCVNRKINSYSDVDVFCNKIYPKFRTDSNGNTAGRVLRFIPNKDRRCMIA